MTRRSQIIKYTKYFLVILAATYLVISCTLRGITRDLDFQVFYTVAQRILSGNINIYDFAHDGIFSYKYSPIAAILFSPLGLLSKTTAQLLWTMLNTFSMIASFFLSWRLLKIWNRLKIKQLNILLLAIFMLAQYYLNNAMQNNINAILLFMMLLSVYLTAIKKYLPVAALLLALTISIKIVPIVLLGYYLFTRQWKVICYTFLFLLLLNIIPIFVWDCDTYYLLVQQWKMVLKDQNHFPFYKWTNQSPYVVWYRLTLSPAIAQTISYLHVFFSLIFFLFSVMSKKKEYILASCLFAILLCSPVVWIEYYIMLTFPTLLILDQFFSHPTSKWWKSLFIIRIIILFLTGKFLIGKTLAEQLAQNSIHYWGLILLVILFLPLLFTDKKCSETKHHF